MTKKLLQLSHDDIKRVDQIYSNIQWCRDILVRLDNAVYAKIEIIGNGKDVSIHTNGHPVYDDIPNEGPLTLAVITELARHRILAQEAGALAELKAMGIGYVHAPS